MLRVVARYVLFAVHVAFLMWFVGCASGPMQVSGSWLNSIRPALVEHCSQQPRPVDCREALAGYNKLAVAYGIANEVAQ